MTEAYNLVDEQWFFLTTTDGTIKPASLRDAFEQADSATSISGGTPLEEIPLMRLLINIIYAALPERLTTTDDWYELWENGLDTDAILAYLEQHHDKFDLFHPEHPFLQAANLTYTKTVPPTNLPLMVGAQKVMDVRGTPRFFYTTHTLDGINRLDIPAAARNLLLLHAYRTGSKQSTARDDTRTKKANYGQPGWLGNGTAALILGPTLQRTLLLNAIPLERFETRDLSEDIAVWERPALTSSPLRAYGDLEEYGLAAGPQTLLTFPTARVRLKRSGDVVEESIVGVGDRIFKYGQHEAESMMTWRLIKRQDGSEVFAPVKTDKKETWRGLDALLAMNPRHKGTQKVAKNISFFRENADYLGLPYMNLKTFEVAYGAQDAIIDWSAVSSISLPSSALQDTTALERILQAVDKANSVAYLVSKLNADILYAAGKTARKEALAASVYLREQFLHHVGMKFDIWVTGVNADNYHERWEAWVEELATAAYEHRDLLIASPPAASFTGQKNKEKPQEPPFTVFTATNIFNNLLRKELND